MQTERPNLAWHFGVLDTDIINAFAAPGGYVFITRGLLLNLQDEAELAGVLAHEIAHVERRHHLLAIKKQARMSLALDVADAMMEQERSALVDSLANVGADLIARGLDRGDEYEADRIGVVVAARGGYEPYGLVDVLTTLDGMSPDDNAISFLFSTHPPAGERLARLDRAMGARLDRYRSQPRPRQRLTQIQARLR
jgi:predicted Zn-dependent protease